MLRFVYFLPTIPCNWYSLQLTDGKIGQRILTASRIPGDLHNPPFHVKLKASQNTSTAFPKRAFT